MVCGAGAISRRIRSIGRARLHLSRLEVRIPPGSTTSFGFLLRFLLLSLLLSTRGSLLLKWGTLTPNLLKCPYGQMGTKPAKVGHLAATLLKYVPKKTSTPGGFEPRSIDLKAGVFSLDQRAEWGKNVTKVGDLTFFYLFFTLT